MKQLQGLCECGEPHNTFVFNWLMFIAGVIVGAYLIGVPMGRSDALERMAENAPQYYKQHNDARGGIKNEL